MTLHSPVHLSAEAFDDLLIGMGSREAEAHLEKCAACRQKLLSFREDVSLFNEASLGWAQARTPQAQLLPRRRPFFVPSPVLGLGAVAMMLVVLGLPVVHRPHPVAIPNTPAASDAADSVEQIAEDNKLMKDVDTAINPDEGSIVAQYHLTESRRSR